MEFILTNAATAVEGNDLHRVVKTAQRVVGMELPHLDFVYGTRKKKKANSISMDSTHLGHILFEPLP